MLCEHHKERIAERERKMRNTLAHVSFLTKTLIIICRYIYSLIKNTKTYTLCISFFVLFFLKLTIYAKVD